MFGHDKPSFSLVPELVPANVVVDETSRRLAVSDTMLDVSIIPPGHVVYGLQLPVQAQSTMFVADWERTCGPDELAAMATKADEAGFFYVAACDHLSIPSRLADAMGTTWYDPVATLAMLAGLTTRVRLMSHVWVAAFRHPLVSAKAFSTLDHLSKGRVIIGVGAGHVPEEFAAIGLDFHRRGALLDEALDAMDVALREEIPAFSGPTWSFSGGGARPRPVQQPRPPIWVGGSSPAAIRRAARRGDGWLPQGTPRAALPEQIADLHRQREAAGIADPIDIGANCEPIYVGEPAWDVGRGVLHGSAERIAESLNQFAAMGVNHLQVRFKARSIDEQLDQMDAFGTMVGPLLKV
jgi:probable F420-dependent oxidoreductase